MLQPRPWLIPLAMKQQNNNSARLPYRAVGFKQFYRRMGPDEWPLLLVLLYHRGCMMNVETITFEMLMKRLRNMLYHQSLCWILTMQTPLSHVSVGKSTMALHGAKSVAIKGLTDKRNIALSFVVSLSGEFLPMQIIYGGKTNLVDLHSNRINPYVTRLKKH